MTTPLYLVTESESYYPSDGTGDWLFVSDDEDRAWAYFAAIEVDLPPHYKHAFLIRITSEGWTVLEET